MPSPANAADSHARHKLLALLQRLCKQFQFLTSVHIKVEVRSVALGAPLLLLLLALLAAPIGISNRYVSFIVVRNWTSLLASVPYLFTYVLFLLDVISPGIVVLLSLTCLFVVIWYRYQVARIALQTTVSLTIGVVVLDVLLTLVISQVVGLLWGA